MNTKLSCSFNCKKLFTNPCKAITKIFKFKLKRPLFIKALKFHKKHKTKTNCFSGLSSVFSSLCSKQPKEMDRLMQLKSFSSTGGHQKAPCPSPLTPAYIKMARAHQEDKDMEDSCRSFENYLVEMIAEEGKMRDLVDVEELLYCWNNLNDPVFVNLVCRFYGELCNDLFSSNVN